MSFDIDADGILHVSASDKATKKEQRIVIQSSGGLSSDQIEAMIRDAETNAAADMKRRESVEAKNELDSLVHSVTKNLSEHGEKLDSETTAAVQVALDDAKTVTEETDLEEIKTKISALSNASMKIGQSIYGKSGSGGAAEGESKPSDDAKEAEYEEKDKEKK